MTASKRRRFVGSYQWGEAPPLCQVTDTSCPFLTVSKGKTANSLCTYRYFLDGVARRAVPGPIAGAGLPYLMACGAANLTGAAA